MLVECNGIGLQWLFERRKDLAFQRSSIHYNRLLMSDRLHSSTTLANREGRVALADAESSPNPPWCAKGVFASSRTRTFLLGLLLIVVTVAVYSPVHRYPFFNVDDGFYVVENVHVHNGLGWETVKWAFTSLSMGNWIPLSFLSHALDYRLFGANPAGHHVINALLHALNAALLFWVLKRATGFTGRSFMVAALFALHPMNVEGVVWVAERKTELSMVFFLLALGAYRWYVTEPRDRRYAAVVLLFALGLTAKAQIITLPFVMLLWDYWPLQRMFPTAQDSSFSLASKILPSKSFFELVREKVPLMFLSGADALITMYTEPGARPQFWPPFPVRLENAVFSYARYLVRAVWPSGMAPFYPNPGNSLAMWQVLGAFILLIGISVLVIAGHRHRYLPVGWLWFLGTLIPMLEIIQFGREGMADRFVYQAFLGLFIMICWGLSDWAAQLRISTAWLASASAVVLLALATVTYRQVGYWKDNLTLWSHAARVVKNDWIAEDWVGAELMKLGRMDEALPHFFTAAAVNPNDGLSNFQIGLYEQKRGNSREAITRYQQALHDQSEGFANIATVWENMGIAYRNLGDSKKARECFENAASFRRN